MISTSNEVLEAWLSPARQLSIKLELNGVSYDSDTISTLSYDSASIAGETFAIGSTYMNSIKVEFPNIIESVVAGQEITPHIGILVNGSYEYIPLGKFIVDEFDRDRNGNKTTIEAKDQMIFLEGQYQSKLKYPAAIREVALEAANLAGVEVNTSSFAALGAQTIAKPEGYTYRQVLGIIAQFEAGFVKFDRYGKLCIQTLQPTTFKVGPDNYLLKGLTKNENTYRIGGISVKLSDEAGSTLQVGSTNGSQVELENPFMTRNLLNAVWDKVKGITFFPFELKWQGCPALEAGDWMYIKDKEGNQYSVPNLSYSLEFNGGLSAKSAANTNVTSEANYKYRGSLSQKIDYVESLLSSNGWNSNYYDNATPNDPKEGDLWFKTNGKDMEIWQYELVNGVLQWVLKVSTAPDEELLQLFEEVKKAAEDAAKAGEEAAAAAEEAAAAGQEAKDLVESVQDEIEQAISNSNKAVEDARAAIAQANFANTAVQVAIEQSADALEEAQSALQKATELANAVSDLEGSITDVQLEIDTINGRLQYTVSKTDFDLLSGKVSTNSTNIQANTNAISLKANKSEVDLINQTVINHSATLITQADKISGLVSKTDTHTTQIGSLQLEAGKLTSSMTSLQTDFDNLSIGGRNLIRNSKLVDDTNGWTIGNCTVTVIAGEYTKISKTATTSARSSFYRPFTEIIPEVSQEYTMSCWLYVESYAGTGTDSTIFIRTYNSAGNAMDFASVNFSSYAKGTWHYVQMTGKTNGGTIPSKGLQVSLAISATATATVRTKLWKIEKGNVATDWSAAFEDYTTVTQFSEFQQTVEGFQTTVNNTLSNYQSQFTQLSNSIQSVVTDVGNLSSGSGNMFTDSRGATTWSIATATGVTQSQIDEAEAVCGKAKRVVMAAGSGGPHKSPLRKLTVGKTYSWSVYIKSTVDGNLTVGSEQGGTKSCAVRSHWQKFTHKFVATDTTYWSFVFYRLTTTITDISIHSPVLTEGNVIPNWSESIGDFVSQSQITQLATDINLRVSKNDIVNQINISTESILIAGNKVHITGTTTIDSGIIKTAHILDANITTAKIASLAVTEAKIGSLAVTTAKIADAAITNAKIGSAAITNAKIADAAISNAKIQDATIASAKIASIDASKIVAATLSALTTNTGQLNVTGWLDFTTENRGLRGSYDFGDPYNNAFNYRWFVGDFRLSHRHLYYSGETYTVTSSNTKGTKLGTAETYYGLDYLKMRSWGTNSVMNGRTDIAAQYISMSTSFSDSVNVSIKVDGTGYFRSALTVAGGIVMQGEYAIKTYSLESRDGADNVYINKARTDLAGFRIGKDGSTLNGGRLVSSVDIYKRTYSGVANVIVHDTGTIGRITSARKYKTDIQVANDVIADAKKVLKINPSSWLDKGEVADGIAKKRYYGFIADDFDALGLSQVVIYEGDQIESLAYDRIPIYHNVILTEHEREIQELKTKVRELENRVMVLELGKSA